MKANMKANKSLRLLLWIAGIALGLVVLSMGFHADGSVQVLIKVAVQDNHGKPVQGAEVYFKHFDESPKPDRFVGLAGQQQSSAEIADSDINGNAVIRGRFGVAIHLPIPFKEILPGMIGVEKPGYKPLLYEIPINKYGKDILKKQLLLTLSLEPV